MADEQEEKDLVVLRAAIVKTKENCFSYMAHLDSANAHELEISGYKGKTNAEAMQLAFRMYNRDIKKLINNHVKKYPDD